MSFAGNQHNVAWGAVVYFLVLGDSAVFGYAAYQPGVAALDQISDLVVAAGCNFLRELAGLVPDEIRVARTAPIDLRLAQTQANGPADFAAVNALQAEYKLTPLTAWGKPYVPPTNVPVNNSVALKPTPPEQVAGMDAGAFFNRLAMTMKDNPP